MQADTWFSWSYIAYAYTYAQLTLKQGARLVTQKHTCGRLYRGRLYHGSSKLSISLWHSHSGRSGKQTPTILSCGNLLSLDLGLCLLSDEAEQVRHGLTGKGVGLGRGGERVGLGCGAGVRTRSRGRTC